MRQSFAYGIVFFGLVACSASPDGMNGTDGMNGMASASKHYDPPAGCGRTACNVDQAVCEKNAQASCDKCQVDCAVIEIEYQLQCQTACNNLCSNTKKIAAGCADTAKSCVASSPRNAFCADGVKNECVPLQYPGVAKLPDAKGHTGVCSDTDIDGLLSQCLLSGTQTQCSAFVSKHQSCVQCAVGPTGAEPLWSVDKDEKTLWTNDGLCVALRGDVECGRAVFAADTCEEKACVSCTGDGVGACIEGAKAISCATEQAKKDACVAKLPADVRADCITTVNGDFAKDARLMIRQACGN